MSGAFLAPGFPAAATDFGTPFGFLGSVAHSGSLGFYDVVDDFLIRLDGEYFICQGDFPDRLSSLVIQC
jgi:hypothetical protein